MPPQTSAPDAEERSQGASRSTQDCNASKQAWLAYYSRKRIIHQWTQVHLLAMVECRRILEIGPALGLVTSMLANIGYEVETLDHGPRTFDYLNFAHHRRDLRDLRGHEIHGYDAILCCETLEHIEWHRVGSILYELRDSGAKYLIVSVPYMAFQIFVEVYLNRLTARQHFSMKKLLWRKEFTAEPPGGHQWEVGYRGYALRDWENRLAASGWSIIRREFTGDCLSVFHLVEAG